MTLELERSIVDPANYQQTLDRFSAANIRLPKLSELADPRTIDAGLREELLEVDPDAPDELARRCRRACGVRLLTSPATADLHLP